MCILPSSRERVFEMTNLFSGNCSLIFVPDVNENVVYPKPEDLWSQVPLALVILVLRYIFGK